MPTNEERREVVKELRYTASHSLNGYGFQRAVEGIVFGTLGDRPWMETMTRLADLIEPEPERTCTFSVKEREEDPYPTCSECGYETDFGELMWYFDNTFKYENKYCPNCGAKVFEE